jgi:hypothetical protein
VFISLSREHRTRGRSINLAGGGSPQTRVTGVPGTCNDSQVVDHTGSSGLAASDGIRIWTPLNGYVSAADRGVWPGHGDHNRFSSTAP